jgi:hypothetical protein
MFEKTFRSKSALMPSPNGATCSTMKTLPAAALLLFASSCIHLWADAKSDALQKLAQVSNPPMVITQDQASGSPSVVLTDKGVLINKSKTPVPFDQVLTALAALPQDAWPYGRVVFYSPAPAADSGAAAPPQAVVDQVEADLLKANIRLLHTAPR